MSDIHNTTHAHDEGDADIPVLTDVIEDEGVSTLPDTMLSASSGGTGTHAPAMTAAVVTATEATEDTRAEL